MARKSNMINKIIPILATCSVSCSFMLLFWSSAFDNNKDVQQRTNLIGDGMYFFTMSTYNILLFSQTLLLLLVLLAHVM